MIIDNELLAAYAEGNVSDEEREAVRHYLAENPDAMESVLFAMDCYDGDEVESENYMEGLEAMLDDIEAEPTAVTIPMKGCYLPMTAMAANNTIDNLCVIKCEGIAMRHFGIEVTEEQLLAESEKQGWLKPDGVALHNVGNLSGARGLSISHRYECTLDDIRASLSADNVVIAAVDSFVLAENSGRPMGNDSASGTNHVVVVDTVTEECVIVVDPATPAERDVYPLEVFLDAWEDSVNYLTVISNSKEYTPHPINLENVELDEQLLELREAIAENAHEVWAATRMSEGWTYGPFRDDEKLENPDMISYNLLSETEKDYDRLLAMNTLKLVEKLGWEIRKKENVEKREKRSRAQGEVQFSDMEHRAIATLILKMLCADKRILPVKLVEREKLYKELGVTHYHEQNTLTFSQACQIYQGMDAGKRPGIRKALERLAKSDGDLSVEEKNLLEELEKLDTACS